MYLKEVLLLALSFISIIVTERKTVSAEKKIAKLSRELVSSDGFVLNLFRIHLERIMRHKQMFY